MGKEIEHMAIHTVSTGGLEQGNRLNGHNNAHNGNGHSGESLKDTVPLAVAPKPQTEPQPDKKPVTEPIATITDIRFTVVDKNGADNSYIKIVNDGTKQPAVEKKKPEKQMTDDEKKVRMRQILEPYEGKSFYDIFVAETAKVNGERKKHGLPPISSLRKNKK